MRAVLLTTAAANQTALANRLHQRVGLTAVLLTEKRRRAKAKRSPLRQAARKAAGLPLARGWRSAMDAYRREFPRLPEVAAPPVGDVNGPAALAALRDLRPDLVLVSGTDLIRGEVIDELSGTCRVMNLHTGISPFVRGGPNCTNWCLATRSPELIGNTVMWIDAGIDTGQLITTERTPLTGRESLAGLQTAVLDHAHDMYGRAAAAFADNRDIASVPQDALGEGTTYYSRQWTSGPMLRAAWNHRRHFASDVAAARTKDTPTVALGAGRSTG